MFFTCGVDAIILHMKIVIQRVSKASVEIEGKKNGQIEKGFLLLVGISEEDNEDIVKKMALKVSKLRIFEDDAGKMNLALNDVGGSILSISQFTLYADTKKGNRPSFTNAGSPEKAKALYLLFNEELRNLGYKVDEGIFGSEMKVELLNDGPVTIIIDSKEW